MTFWVLAGAVVLVMAAFRFRAGRRHKAFVGRLQGLLLDRGFAPGYGDHEYRRFERATDPVAISIHDDFIVITADALFRLPDGLDYPRVSVAVPGENPRPVTGDAQLDGAVRFERIEGDWGLPFLVADAERRAALRRFGTTIRSDYGERRGMEFGGARVALQVFISGEHTPPEVLAGAIDAVEDALLLLEGLDRIPSLITWAADDPTLTDDLRRRARHGLVLDFPSSPEARRFAPELVDDARTAVAACARLIVDDLEGAVERVCVWPFGDEDGALQAVGGRALARVIEAAVAADRADLVRRILASDPAITLAWLGRIGRPDSIDFAAELIDPDVLPDLRHAAFELLSDQLDGPVASDLERVLIAALAFPSAADRRAAALILAHHGTLDCLRPLGAYRATVTGVALTFALDSGLARIRDGLDPTLAGQLSVASSGEGSGGLAVTGEE